jgi:hypothetical protein
MTLLTACATTSGWLAWSACPGYLPLAASTAAERSDANALAPIFLAHAATTRSSTCRATPRDALARWLRRRWHDTR